MPRLQSPGRRIPNYSIECASVFDVSAFFFRILTPLPPRPLIPSLQKAPGDRTQTVRRSTCGRLWSLAGLFLFSAASLPAPDFPTLKKLPLNLFQKKNDELLETAQAPSGPGGMGMLPSGDYIIACHPFFMPQHRVMRLGKDGQWMPFPNEAMNTPGSGDPLLLDSVLGLACDSRCVVWLLDNERLSGSAAKLVAWDTKRDELH